MATPKLEALAKEVLVPDGRSAYDYYVDFRIWCDQNHDGWKLGMRTVMPIGYAIPRLIEWKDSMRGDVEAYVQKCWDSDDTCLRLITSLITGTRIPWSATKLAKTLSMIWACEALASLSRVETLRVWPNAAHEQLLGDLLAETPAAPAAVLSEAIADAEQGVVEPKRGTPAPTPTKEKRNVNRR